jgi:squalene-associated FAD-dependent desaturase
MRDGNGRVVVVGGGLAGLACALRLAEGNVATTLVERRPYPGGKTFSFADTTSGIEIDNGQHLFLRCCTAYRSFIDRLGLSGQMMLQPHLRVPVLDPASGRRSEIAAKPNWMPAPLQLGWSLLRFVHLSWREKLGLGRAALPLWRMGASGRRKLDDGSFADWLRARGQSDRVIDRFWDLIVLPTCNDRSAAVSAQQAAMVFQVGLLDGAHNADIGLPRVGLSRIADAAVEAIEARSGEVRRATTVRALEPGPDGVSRVTFADGSSERVAAVVLAVPPNAAERLLPAAWREHEDLASLSAFEYSPIVNVHVHWDRTVMDDTFVAVLDPSLQYVFNRSRINSSLAEAGGDDQWLACSLSGAHDVVGRTKKEIAEETIEALRRAFPPARAAMVLHWNVVTEREATFRASPGTARHRLGAETSIDNLFLAGAWTDTEWPGTMESAVLSGEAAAAAVLRRFG